MKQIYVCEKCGAQFDNWNEAHQCEDGHVDSFDVDPEWNPEIAWDEGCAFPKEVVVRSKEWDWRTDKYLYRYFRYKAVGPLTKKRVAELEAERIKRETEAEAAYKKLVAEREKERAAEQEQEVV